MATGLKSFIHCQFGVESTYGTRVPATTVMPGLTTGAHELMETNLYPETYQGDVVLTHDRVQVGSRGDLDLQGILGYENLPYFSNMAMAAATPATDGGTPPAYTYANTPGITSVDVPKSFSIEAGDNSRNWSYAGCVCSHFTIQAEVDGLTSFQATIFAKSRLLQAKTAALTAFTLDPLLGNYWSLYIDNGSGGTIGTTAYTGCLRGFKYDADGFTPFKCIDGTGLLTSTQQLPLNPTLELTVAADDPAATLLSTYHEVGTAFALVRLRQVGSVIHDAITKRVTIDGAYFVDTVSKYGSADVTNVNLLTFTLRGKRASSPSLVSKLETVIAASALP